MKTLISLLLLSCLAQAQIYVNSINRPIVIMNLDGVNGIYNYMNSHSNAWKDIRLSFGDTAYVMSTHLLRWIAKDGDGVLVRCERVGFINPSGAYSSMSEDGYYNECGDSAEFFLSQNEWDALKLRSENDIRRNIQYREMRFVQDSLRRVSIDKLKAKVRRLHQ